MGDLFGLGLDMGVWHKVYSLNADGEMFWSAPECLQGRFSSSVSVAKDTSGQMHVFARGLTRPSGTNRRALTLTTWPPGATGHRLAAPCCTTRANCVEGEPILKIEENK